MSRLLSGLVLSALSAVCFSTFLDAAGPAPVAEAAQQRDAVAVRALLKQGSDVNAAQGDGMTALHWAALQNDAELATMLLYAGANVRATTRLGGYTPLHLASQSGAAAAIAPLIKSGAAVGALTSTGATPLMLAAAAGSVEVVNRLIEAGADANAVDTAHGETALMFAAALDRTEVVRALIAKGADVAATAKVVDLAALTAPGEEAFQASSRRPEPMPQAPETRQSPAREANASQPSTGAPAPAPAAPKQIPGVSRGFLYNELIGAQGGLTALHFASRQGAFNTVQALVDSGANVNQVSPGDRMSPLLIATINGHFDIAKYLLDKGADPNASSDAGVTPLYAVINVQWAPKAFYPQPRAYLQQKISYLDFMTLLLDKGADPNVRLRRKIWYSTYNFDNLRIDEVGASPFWRAAYASDVDAMKLLVARGADPHVPTMKPAGQGRRRNDGAAESVDTSGLTPLPVGAVGIPSLQAAAGWGYGDGFAGNAHRFAPSGMMAAVKYLVEEIGADVNERDYDGNTALHQAAARGDNEMVQYLVAKGADVTVINRDGQTTVDMANGPVQRIQPFPETIALLEKLGAKNNHKCISC
ncbi:MAG: ankyrin repeat domain-containing protein [Vicinamibacterales bacterium]